MYRQSCTIFMATFLILSKDKNTQINKNWICLTFWKAGKSYTVGGIVYQVTDFCTLFLTGGVQSTGKVNIQEYIGMYKINAQAILLLILLFFFFGEEAAIETIGIMPTLSVGSLVDQFTTIQVPLNMGVLVPHSLRQFGLTCLRWSS